MKLSIIALILLICPPVGVLLLMYGHSVAVRRRGEATEDTSTLTTGIDVAAERASRPLWPRDWSRPDAYCGVQATL